MKKLCLSLLAACIFWLPVINVHAQATSSVLTLVQPLNTVADLNRAYGTYASDMSRLMSLPYQAAASEASDGGAMLKALLLKGKPTIGERGSAFKADLVTPVMSTKIWTALKAVGTGPLGLAILAAPFVLDWLADADVGLNQGADKATKPFMIPLDGACVAGVCYEWRVVSVLPWVGSYVQACKDYVTWRNGNNPTYPGTYVSVSHPDGTPNNNSRCTYHVIGPGVNADESRTGVETRAAPSGGGSTRPATWEEARPYMADKVPPVGILNDILSRGVPIETERPTVTGPATSPGTTTTSTGISTETQPGVAGVPVTTTIETTTTQTTTTNNTYNENKIVQTVITTTTTTETRRTPEQNPDGSPATNPDGSPKINEETKTGTTTDGAPGAPGKNGENGSDASSEDMCAKHPDAIACQTGEATDTPLPPVPDLYTQKYPDGLGGVWNSRKAEMQGTSLATFVLKTMPSGLGAGTCPEWSLNLDVGIWDGGVHDISVPCNIWLFGRVVIVISALLLARRLVFGG